MNRGKYRLQGKIYSTKITRQNPQASNVSANEHFIQLKDPKIIDLIFKHLESSTSKRNMGGRKPKSISYLSPEEEEKRRVRRERNKLAAARCRKRRVDQTNTLTDLVDQLEAEKNQLKLEIQELELAKKDLEYLLQTHRTQCKITVNAVIDVSGADKNMPKSKLEFKAPAIHTPLLERIKQEIDDSSYDDREPGVPPLKRALISAANPVFGAASNPAIATLTSAKPNRPRLVLDHYNHSM